MHGFIESRYGYDNTGRGSLTQKGFIIQRFIESETLFRERDEFAYFRIVVGRAHGGEKHRFLTGFWGVSDQAVANLEEFRKRKYPLKEVVPERALDQAVAIGSRVAAAAAMNLSDCDFMLVRNGKLYFLEANSFPGLNHEVFREDAIYEQVAGLITAGLGAFRNGPGGPKCASAG
jgi:hypothetical protein